MEMTHPVRGAEEPSHVLLGSAKSDHTAFVTRLQEQDTHYLSSQAQTWMAAKKPFFG